VNFFKSFLVAAATLMVGLTSGLAQESTSSQVEAAAGGVLVFGGTRNTGFEVVKILRGQDVPVTVFVRPTSDRTLLEPLGVNFVVGDAMEADSVKAAFEGQSFDAVLTTLGCNLCDVPPDYEGNRNVFDGASASGVSRVIMVSSIGAGNSRDAMPWIARFILRESLKLKTQAEDYLQGTELDYTIVRPGNLKDGEPTGTASLSEDASVGGVIRRSDLAGLIVGVMEDEAAIGKVYSAVGTDP